MFQGSKVKMNFPDPGTLPTIELDGVEIPPGQISEIQMMVGANGSGHSSPMPIVGIRLVPSSDFDFEGLATVNVSRPSAPIRPLIASIDRDELREQVDKSGFREHPADIVLDVILRMAEDHDDDVQSGETSGSEAIQRSSGNYSRGSETDFGR